MTGVYFYQYAFEVYPVLRLERFSMPVEIIETKGTRYRVKFLAHHMGGAKPGSLHWVQQRKVRLNPPRISPENIIRLPYKD